MLHKLNNSLSMAFLSVIFISSVLFAQTRKEINLPDIPGYFTLKCDFHMHTPFSDGTVWPPDRVTEAWIEGLDAISITDHVEYQAYAADVKVRPNRSYELALPRAKELGMLLIQGAEITRAMPPGHFNALFISDDSMLKVEDPMKALEAAANQNAFIFWNHPGWKGQQPDGVPRWYDEHTTLYEKGWLKGIEIVNSKEYYPTVFKWAIDKNLTLLGNSDIHYPIGFRFDEHLDQHRPLTLVFAREHSTEAIREALEEGRTAVWFEDLIFGHEQELKPLFAGMIKVQNPRLSVGKGNKIHVNLHNHSDIDLSLSAEKVDGKFKGPEKIKLPTHLTMRIALDTDTTINVYEPVRLKYLVNNMLVGPNQPLSIELSAEAINLNIIGIEPKGEHEYGFNPVDLPEEIKIVYTIDGSQPDLSDKTVNEGFRANGPVTLKMKAFKGKNSFGETAIKKIILHRGLGEKVNLKTAPSPKYHGIGATTLTNGELGSLEYTDGNWLGFEKNDLVATTDFGKELKAKTIEVRFLENQKSWIFLPREVCIKVSGDGKTFTEIFHQELPLKKSSDTAVKSLTCDIPDSRFQYLRIQALNQGKCPDWHQGAGGKAWLFVDEIIVR